MKSQGTYVKLLFFQRGRQDPIGDFARDAFLKLTLRHTNKLTEDLAAAFTQFDRMRKYGTRARCIWRPSSSTRRLQQITTSVVTSRKIMPQVMAKGTRLRAEHSSAARVDRASSGGVVHVLK